MKYHTPDHGSTAKSGFKTKKAAQLWAATNTISMTNGSYTLPAAGKMTVGELGPDWLDGKRGLMKASSMHSLDTSWNTWVKPQWGNRAVDSIRKSEVQKWVSEISGKRSASITMRAFGILRGIYEPAQDDQLINSTPAQASICRASAQRTVSVSRRSSFSSCFTRLAPTAAFILVLGLCGLRWGKASRWQVKDI